MSAYGWIITADHLSALLPNDRSEIGVTGPRDITAAHLQQLQAGEGHVFRMRDDDGELYYTGRFVGDPTSEDGFGPLHDFGLPNAGCTSIEYRTAAGTWEVL